MAGAGIFVENAMSDGKQAFSYMIQPQSQVYIATTYKVQAKDIRVKVARGKLNVTQGQVMVLETMEASQLAQMVDKFVEYMDLQTNVRDSVIGESTSTSTPQTSRISVENLLDKKHLIDGRAPSF